MAMATASQRPGSAGARHRPTLVAQGGSMVTWNPAVRAASGRRSPRRPRAGRSAGAPCGQPGSGQPGSGSPAHGRPARARAAATRGRARPPRRAPGRRAPPRSAICRSRRHEARVRDALPCHPPAPASRGAHLAGIASADRRHRPGQRVRVARHAPAAPSPTATSRRDTRKGAAGAEPDGGAGAFFIFLRFDCARGMRGKRDGRQWARAAGSNKLRTHRTARRTARPGRDGGVTGA